MKNDIQLQHDVRAQLEHEWRLTDDTIGVEVHHGVVKLAGHVRDYATIENAEFAARNVDGVTTVVMDIDVIGTGAVRRSARGLARLTGIA